MERWCPTQQMLGVFPMKKAFLAGVAALSVLYASAAHTREWQGNMPKPIGKLPQYPPVVCVTPNWTPEPCESRQPSPVMPPVPKTVIRHDNGGYLREYIERWSNISAQGGQVEVLGRCVSACTLVTAYIPKDRICFGPDASLDFHQAYISKPEFNPAVEATKWMLEKYPADIRHWIADQGRYRMGLDWNVRQGSETPPLYGFWTLPAEELWKIGYRKCGE